MTNLTTPGVVGLHALRTRRMAHQVRVDAHVQANPRIAVWEGRHIAWAVRARVRKAYSDVLDVPVDVGVENDVDMVRQGTLPERDELLRSLASCWGKNCPSRCRSGCITPGARLKRNCIFRSNGFRRMIAQRAQQDVLWGRDVSGFFARSPCMALLHASGAFGFLMHLNGAF